MILLEIDPIGIAIDEFECYTPRTVDVDRVTLAALQGVEVETGEIHVFGPCSILQSIEPTQAARMHGLLNLSCGAPFEQLLQAFVLEAFDHARM
jgi:hypothetical protein